MLSGWKALVGMALLSAGGAALAERWQDIATPADAERLKQRDATFAAALREVRASEYAGELAKNALLYDPDRRLDDPLPPEGRYLCATHKLGGQFLSFIAYPDFICAIYGTATSGSSSSSPDRSGRWAISMRIRGAAACSWGR